MIGKLFERELSTVLNERNSKALWEKVDWKGSVGNKNESTDTPDLNDLSRHFQMKSSTPEISTLFSEVKKNQYVPTTT